MSRVGEPQSTGSALSRWILVVGVLLSGIVSASSSDSLSMTTNGFDFSEAIAYGIENLTRRRSIALDMSHHASACSTAENPSTKPSANGSAASADNQSSNPGSRKVFQDDIGHFTAFMNHPGISGLLLAALYTSVTRGSYYLEMAPYEIYEVAAMNLYKTCQFCGYVLNRNGTPTEITLAELADELDTQGFKLISIAGFKLNYTPSNALKFFDTYFKTHTLDLSETLIDVHQLNETRLQHVEIVSLSRNELTELPPLFNFPRLKLLDLSYNLITDLTATNYMNEKTSMYEKMPATLNYVALFWNPVQSFHLDLTEVFSPATEMFVAGRSVAMDREDVRRKLAGTCVKLAGDN